MLVLPNEAIVILASPGRDERGNGHDIGQRSGGGGQERYRGRGKPPILRLVVVIWSHAKIPFPTCTARSQLQLFDLFQRNMARDSILVCVINTAGFGGHDVLSAVELVNNARDHHQIFECPDHHFFFFLDSVALLQRTKIVEEACRRFDDAGVM